MYVIHLSVEDLKKILNDTFDQKLASFHKNDQKPVQSDDDILDAEEAASYLHCSKSKLYKLIGAKKIYPLNEKNGKKRVGKHLFKRGILKLYLENY